MSTNEVKSSSSQVIPNCPSKCDIELINEKLNNKLDKPVKIPIGADLNDYKTSGFYFTEDNGTTNYIKNLPQDNRHSFALLVQQNWEKEFELSTQIYISHAQSEAYSQSIWFRTQGNINENIFWQPWSKLATAEAPKPKLLPLTEKVQNQDPRPTIYWKTQDNIVTCNLLYSELS